MRYLKGTQKFGILYSNGGLSDFIGYSDADWAGDVEDRKSTSGYSFHQGPYYSRRTHHSYGRTGRRGEAEPPSG